MRWHLPTRWHVKPRTLFLLPLLPLILMSVSGLAYIESQRHYTLVLPRPTGPDAVGRVEYDWTDQARNDPLASEKGAKRELIVWAWYPAQSMANTRTAPYLPQKWDQLSTQQQGSETIQTHSVDGAPLAPATGRYPVLIFEPGLGNIPTQYTTLIEDLASHGYVIFAITPTYSSDVVVFPDGRVVDATPAGKLETNEPFQTAANRLVGVWSKDVLFVIDKIARLNSTTGNKWSQHLDLARLGIFGHSFGGATAAEVCFLDKRCKAGINIDGVFAGDVMQKGLTTPFMVMQHDIGSCSETDCRDFQRDIRTVVHAIPHGAGYNLSIGGTEHMNFSDFAVRPIAQNLRLLGVLGSIDGERGLEIARVYTRAFFDAYVDNIPSPLLQKPSPAYPEVQIATWPIK